MTETETASKTLVELVGVRKSYAFGETTVNALDGVDLKIDRGAFVAVVGRSGSGKSTLLNVLGGLDQPSQGQVLVDGTPLHGRGSDQLAAYRRGTVGFIFQSFNLIPHLTALENVALPLRLAGTLSQVERTQKAAALLAEVGLATRSEHRPSELSGGERQRVAIARSLANGPSLLLADEPTGNLDSKTAADIMAMLVELHRSGERTIVLVTHDRVQAERYCERVVEMADGKVTVDRLVGAAGDTPSTKAPPAEAPQTEPADVPQAKPADPEAEAPQDGAA